jgi:hypothetical protein
VSQQDFLLPFLLLAVIPFDTLVTTITPTLVSEHLLDSLQGNKEVLEGKIRLQKNLTEFDHHSLLKTPCSSMNTLLVES